MKILSSFCFLIFSATLYGQSLFHQVSTENFDAFSIPLESVQSSNVFYVHSELIEYQDVVTFKHTLYKHNLNTRAIDSAALDILPGARQFAGQNMLLKNGNILVFHNAVEEQVSGGPVPSTCLSLFEYNENLQLIRKKVLCSTSGYSFFNAYENDEGKIFFLGNYGDQNFGGISAALLITNDWMFDGLRVFSMADSLAAGTNHYPAYFNDDHNLVVASGMEKSFVLDDRLDIVETPRWNLVLNGRPIEAGFQGVERLESGEILCIGQGPHLFQTSDGLWDWNYPYKTSGIYSFSNYQVNNGIRFDVPSKLNAIAVPTTKFVINPNRFVFTFTTNQKSYSSHVLSSINTWLVDAEFNIIDSFKIEGGNKLGLGYTVLRNGSVLISATSYLWEDTTNQTGVDATLYLIENLGEYQPFSDETLEQSNEYKSFVYPNPTQGIIHFSDNSRTDQIEINLEL